MSVPKNGGKKKHRAGFVAILGRPNAGKSTLLNTLLGTKLAAIASKPQTTRTAIQGVLTLPDAQIVFVDTPGIHKSTTLLNRQMMKTVRAAADAPDVVLFVVDVLTPFSEDDAQALDLAKKVDAPLIAVFNKMDWLDKKPKLIEVLEKYRALHDFAAYVPISARKGDDIETLVDEIVKHLPVAPPLFPADYLTDQPERFLAAEVIREKVLHHTDKEVPHAVAVTIESWEEVKRKDKLQPRLLRISATISVERDGQKAILIGAGGAKLKTIGTLARKELERTLDSKVFLQTFVKVRPGWREDPEGLRMVDWRTE